MAGVGISSSPESRECKTRESKSEITAALLTTLRGTKGFAASEISIGDHLVNKTCDDALAQAAEIVDEVVTDELTTEVEDTTRALAIRAQETEKAIIPRVYSNAIQAAELANEGQHVLQNFIHFISLLGIKDKDLINKLISEFGQVVGDREEVVALCYEALEAGEVSRTLKAAYEEVIRVFAHEEPASLPSQGETAEFHEVPAFSAPTMRMSRIVEDQESEDEERRYKEELVSVPTIVKGEAGWIPRRGNPFWYLFHPDAVGPATFIRGTAEQSAPKEVFYGNNLAASEVFELPHECPIQVDLSAYPEIAEKRWANCTGLILDKAGRMWVIEERLMAELYRRSYDHNATTLDDVLRSGQAEGFFILLDYLPTVNLNLRNTLLKLAAEGIHLYSKDVPVSLVTPKWTAGGSGVSFQDVTKSAGDSGTRGYCLYPWSTGVPKAGPAEAKALADKIMARQEPGDVAIAYNPFRWESAKDFAQGLNTGFNVIKAAAKGVEGAGSIAEGLGAGMDEAIQAAATVVALGGVLSVYNAELTEKLVSSINNALKGVNLFGGVPVLAVPAGVFVLTALFRAFSHTSSLFQPVSANKWVADEFIASLEDKRGDFESFLARLIVATNRYLPDKQRIIGKPLGRGVMRACLTSLNFMNAEVRGRRNISSSTAFASDKAVSVYDALFCSVDRRGNCQGGFYSSGAGFALSDNPTRHIFKLDIIPANRWFVYREPRVQAQKVVEQLVRELTVLELGSEGAVEKFGRHPAGNMRDQVKRYLLEGWVANPLSWLGLTVLAYLANAYGVAGSAMKRLLNNLENGWPERAPVRGAGVSPTPMPGQASYDALTPGSPEFEMQLMGGEAGGVARPTPPVVVVNEAFRRETTDFWQKFVPVGGALWFLITSISMWLRRYQSRPQIVE